MISASEGVGERELEDPLLSRALSCTSLAKKSAKESSSSTQGESLREELLGSLVATSATVGATGMWLSPV